MTSSKPKRDDDRRLMYIEGKDLPIAGERARIGWVTFSKSGQTVYYRGLMLTRMPEGSARRGNFIDLDSQAKYWVSGVRKLTPDHPIAKGVSIPVDEDAEETYRTYRPK